MDLPTYLEANYIATFLIKLVWVCCYIIVYGVRPVVIRPKKVGASLVGFFGLFFLWSVAGVRLDAGGVLLPHVQCAATAQLHHATRAFSCMCETLGLIAQGTIRS